MKGKLKFIIPVPILLIVAAAAYMLVLAPKPAKAKPPKVNGTLVSLTNDFVINLAGGHYAKLGVALLLSSPPPVPAAGSSESVPQEPAIRATITNDLTGLAPARLIDRSSRNMLLTRLLADLKHSTDEPITKVLITDLAVQ